MPGRSREVTLVFDRFFNAIIHLTKNLVHEVNTLLFHMEISRYCLSHKNFMTSTDLNAAVHLVSTKLTFLVTSNINVTNKSHTQSVDWF